MGEFLKALVATTAIVWATASTSEAAQLVFTGSDLSVVPVLESGNLIPTEFLYFPAFFSALGKLNSVTISGTSGVTPHLALQPTCSGCSLPNDPPVIVTLTPGLSIFTIQTSVLLSGSGETAYLLSYNVSASEQEIDFLINVADPSIDWTTEIQGGDQILAKFYGFARLQYPATQVGLSNGEDLSTAGIGDIIVTYNFTPVPEPEFCFFGAAALLSFALRCSGRRHHRG